MSSEIRSTLTNDEEAAVAHLFALAEGRPLPDPPPAELRRFDDADLATCLRLQLDVLDNWLARGEQLGGWKIGFTSRSARDALGVGFRPHGYVLASRIFRTGETIDRSVPHCRLEPEIAVLLGSDLEGEVTIEEARKAVSAVAPAIEINSIRVPTGSSPAVRLGNDLNNWGIVVGADLAPDLVDLASLPVSIGLDGTEPLTSHSGADVVDDPFFSFTRVCRSLAWNGRGLRAGQWLITGSLTPSIDASRPGRYTAAFGSLGSVSVEFR